MNDDAKRSAQASPALAKRPGFDAASGAPPLVATEAAAAAPNAKLDAGPIEAAAIAGGNRAGSDGPEVAGWAATSSTAVNGLMLAEPEAATGEMDMLLSILRPEKACRAIEVSLSMQFPSLCGSQLHKGLFPTQTFQL